MSIVRGRNATSLYVIFGTFYTNIGLIHTHTPTHTYMYNNTWLSRVSVLGQEYFTLNTASAGCR